MRAVLVAGTAAERRKARQRRWALANPEKVKASQKRYAEKHPDRQHAWRRQNWEREKAKMRDRELLTTYGVSRDDYNRMLAEQGGVCAICSTPPNDRELDVDHDHATGRVRGLLCRRCNPALGLFNDNVALLQRAVAYLTGVQ